MSKHNTSFKVDKDNELMKFLIEKMPQNSRNSIKSLLTQRRILVDGKVVSQYNAPVKEGQIVSINKTKITKHNLEGVSIVYEDNDILVVEKERGILSIATKNENDHKTDPCSDIDRISCQLREHADPEADESLHEV